MYESIIKEKNTSYDLGIIRVAQTLYSHDQGHDYTVFAQSCSVTFRAARPEIYLLDMLAKLKGVPDISRNI